LSAPPVNPGGGVIVERLSAHSAMHHAAGVLLERIRSPYQLVEVYDTPEWGRLFRLDGCNMTSEKDEFIYHENMVHPAALAHPAPRKALVIGGGDGGSAEELLKHPSMERVVIVELDQAVVDIAKKYFDKVHHNVFANPKLELRIGDGFAFVRDTTERFDLIALDLTDPAGVAAALYTPAMFMACKRALSADGVLSLHVGSPYYQPARFRQNLRDLAGVFRFVRPYLAYIPTYGAPWGTATASDSIDPREHGAAEIDAAIERRGLADLQYYNGAVHQAGFVLPEFIDKLVR
jgi:spermidine synthase